MVRIDSNVIENILTILFSLLGALLYYLLLRISGRMRRKRISRGEPTSGERIQQSIAKLKDASLAIDDIIQDIVKAVERRQSTLQALEKRCDYLLGEEARLREEVVALKDVRPEALQYFERSLLEIERRRTNRDIFIFILGVVVATILAVLL